MPQMFWSLAAKILMESEKVVDTKTGWRLSLLSVKVWLVDRQANSPKVKLTLMNFLNLAVASCSENVP